MNEHVLQKVTLTALVVYGGVPISFQSEIRSSKIEVETVCSAVRCTTLGTCKWTKERMKENNKNDDYKRAYMRHN